MRRIMKIIKRIFTRKQKLSSGWVSDPDKFMAAMKKPTTGTYRIDAVTGQRYKVTGESR